MTGPRPFRFGVVCARGTSRADWTAKARKVEALGYAILLVPDHLGEQLAPLPALLAAAEATTSLRVGSLVLANDFRHPVVLAKEAATLDLLSAGRFELGLGAGWMRSEYEQAGLRFDPPVIRIERMGEAVRIIKALLGEDPVSFTGAHYSLSGLTGLPKPVQRPRPPILVGGGGRRTLSIAAREADVVGLVPRAHADGGGLDVTDATAAATIRKVEWIRAEAEERFAELELNLLVQAVVATDDRRAAAAQLAARFRTTAELVLDTPYVLMGTHGQIEEDLRERRERYGVSYLAVFESSMDALAPVVARLAGA